MSVKATESTGCEKDLLALGSAYWRSTYAKQRDNDEHAYNEIVERFRSYGEVLFDGQMPESFIRRIDDRSGRVVEKAMLRNELIHVSLAATRWVDGGCRVLATDDKYFAAMAQTKCDGLRDDLRIPWPAFVMRIPSGLVVGADGAEYTTAIFAQFTSMMARTANLADVYRAGVVAFYSIMSQSGVAIHGYWPDLSLADMLFEEQRNPNTSVVEESIADVDEAPGDMRIREIVKRAAAGLLFTMQHTNNWRFGGHFDRVHASTRRGPPAHRTILIGRPLAIDVRSAVRADAVSGERSAPSVQTLVRGHLKRQVVGIGRKGRKVVWVEPYWRGPENAPILARPHRIAQ